MKALRKLSDRKHDIALVDIPEPVCGINQVKIKVKYAGICASDLHILNNDIKLNIKTPVTIGHEFSGLIVESRSSAYAVGELVTSETTFDCCGTCEFCKSNQYNLCPSKQLIGYWYDGAFAEYVVVPAHRVHRVKEAVQGTLLEPFACVNHALHESGIQWQGKNILISGPGVIGQMAAYTIYRDNLSSNIMMVGVPTTSHFRSERAKRISKYFLANELYKIPLLTHNNGVDVFIECSGTKTSINTGLSVLNRGGTFIQIGLTSKHDSHLIDFAQVSYKELTVKGFIGSNIKSWRTAKMMMNEKLVDFIQPTMFTLDEYEIALAYAESGMAIKVMFEM